MKCQAFRDEIFHFQRDELSEDVRLEMLRHIEACEPCARRFEFEASFERELRSRCAPVPAPPGLETRIRAALSAEAPEPSRGAAGWWRAPWLAATAAAVLLIALLAVEPPSPLSTTAPPVTVGVEFEATIVDHECDAHGLSLSLQRRCADPTHTNALKRRDGSYVQFSLGDEDIRRLVVDPDQRGRRVIVAGELYPGIRTLHVTEVRDSEQAYL